MSVINFHMFNLSTTVQTHQISLNSKKRREKEKQVCGHWKKVYEDSEQKLLSGVQWGRTYIKHSSAWVQEQHNQQDYIVKVQKAP